VQAIGAHVHHGGVVRGGVEAGGDRRERIAQGAGRRAQGAGRRAQGAGRRAQGAGRRLSRRDPWGAHDWTRTA
jgi:hypothetical protein